MKSTKRVAEFRKRRADSGTCLRCPAPAKLNRHGKAMKACGKHLKMDAARILARRRSASPRAA